jgi:uncharacterized protein with HEPN domain
MQRDDLALVEDMLTEISDAIEFVQGYDLRTFLEDRRTRKAVAYSIQIMGEAARGISLQFKADHPEVAWPQIVGMRHRIVHEYGAVNFRIVWAVVQEDLPRLQASLLNATEG